MRTILFSFATLTRAAFHFGDMSDKVLRVCTTPDDAFLTIDLNADKLRQKVAEEGGNYTLRCSQLGEDPEERWAAADSDLFPITGYIADVLIDVVRNMGSDWSCVVHILPSYTSALYATGRQKICDVAFQAQTATAQRAYCENYTSYVTGTPACPEYNPSITWANATRDDTCCNSFSTPPFMITFPGGFVLRDANIVEVTGGGIDLGLAIEAINLLSWYWVCAFGFAHLAWVAEKTNPSGNPLPRFYVDGIIAATFHVVVNSLYNMTTAFGRAVAIAYTVFKMAFFALLTGSLASTLTLSNQEAVYRWTDVSDIGSDTVVCVIAEHYLELDAVQQASPQSYKHESGIYTDCVNDVINGKADMAVRDIVYNQWLVAQNSSLNDIGMVVPYSGSSSVYAPSLRGDLIESRRSVLEQAMTWSRPFMIERQHEYFPNSDICSTDDAASDDDSPEDTQLDYVPLAITVVFAGFLIIASNVQSIQHGQKCLLARFIIICKNRRREHVLKNRIEYSAMTGIEDLADAGRAVFLALDVKSKGKVSDHALDRLVARVLERHGGKGKAVPDNDVAQIKELLLQIFLTNIDGEISIAQWHEIFQQTIATEGAKMLLEDIAWEINHNQKAAKKGANKEAVEVELQTRRRRQATANRTTGNVPIERVAILPRAQHENGPEEV